MVAGIGDVEVSGGIEDQVGRVVELRQGGGAAIARKARGPGPRDRADDLGRGIDAAYAMVETSRDVQVARRVEREPAWLRAETRLAGGAAVATMSRMHAIPGEGGQQSGCRIDSADAAVARVGDEQVALRVE